MFDTAIRAVAVRTGQTAVEASSTLLIGFLVAAVLRRMLGAAGTRRLFGGPGLGGLVRAWAIGSLLPVCSLGVIPVARELHRAGVRSGTVLAFVLAAPQLNPLSLLYGLTLSEPIVIVSYVAATLVIAVAGGALWNRLFAAPADTLPPGDEAMPAPGLKRLAAVVVAAARDVVGPSLGYVALGIAATGLLTGLLPFGCLGHAMRHDDPTSPLLMAAIGVPAYSGVLPGMMRIGLMFDHGNSAGAAFVLFELGVGLNVGLIAWLAATFGGRRVLAWLGLVAGLTLAAAYAMEYPLYFAHEEEAHTHAFDDWTSPFPAGASGDWPTVGTKVAQRVEILEPFGLGGLAVLLLLGAVLRLADPAGRFDAWLRAARPPSGRPPSVWNRDVPGPVLGLAALAGLVVFSVVALYIYYPAPAAALDEMTRVRTDALVAVNSGKAEEATRQLQQWDLLIRKLQVGAFLRTGRLDPGAAAKAEDLRERLEEVRDALLAGDRDGAKARVPAAEAAYRECRGAYAPAGDRLRPD
jgi:hypothetical protein